MKTQNTKNNHSEQRETIKKVMAESTVKLSWQKNSLKETNPALMETIELPIEERGVPLF